MIVAGNIRRYRAHSVRLRVYLSPLSLEVLVDVMNGAVDVLDLTDLAGEIVAHLCDLIPQAEDRIEQLIYCATSDGVADVSACVIWIIAVVIFGFVFIVIAWNRWN